MAGYINTGKGLLVLPGGVEAPFGVEVPVSKDAAANVAVVRWIAEGRLVPAADWAPVAQDTIDALRAERDDLAKDRDDLAAQVADLEAQVAALTPAPKK